MLGSDQYLGQRPTFKVWGLVEKLHLSSLTWALVAML